MLKVFNKIVDLQNQLFEDRKKGKEIGFVPTMGALHEGHASLVRRSVKENGITVVSEELSAYAGGRLLIVGSLWCRLCVGSERRGNVSYAGYASVRISSCLDSDGGCSSSWSLQWCLSGCE